MHDQVMLGIPSQLFFAANDPREIFEFGIISTSSGFEGDFLDSLLEFPPRSVKRQPDFWRLKRMDLEHAVFTDDLKVPSWKAKRIEMVATNRRDRVGIIEDGQLVVQESIFVGITLAIVRGRSCRLAKNRDHCVNEMAGQFKHSTAAVLTQVASQIVTRLLSHCRSYFGDATQPALPNNIKQQFKGRVVSKHVSHLNRKPLLVGQPVHGPARLHRFTGRFVQVDMFARGETVHRVRDQIRDTGLHGDRSDVTAQQSFLGYPGDVTVGLRIGDLNSTGFVFFDDPYQLEDVR